MLSEMLQAARRAMGWYNDTSNKLVPLAGVVDDSLKIVGAEYARELVAAIEPAKLSVSAGSA